MEKLQIPELKSENEKVIVYVINQIINGNAQVCVPIRENNEIVGFKSICQRDKLNEKILNINSKISYLSGLKYNFMRSFKFRKAKKINAYLEAFNKRLEELKGCASYDIYQDEEENIYNFEDIFKEYQYDSETGSYKQVSLEVSDADDISKGLKYITEMR